ncbi:LPXTG-site transpeptidase (sortase) family protein [Streptomyces sp. LBL]|uniref:class F sortase n=1 Tax=Streptomyces sp. LBL TaxID=2940562 RepID=UPI002474EC63|nr:class F sortase [Streptomyces sp. LBL]MDH6629654.1 LPXTG-site transpeptidase (sortase) family protein [Streptomyces sp. LBL]
MAVPPPSPTDDKPVPTPQGPRGGVMVLCATALLILATSLAGGHDTSSDNSGPPQSHPAPQAPRTPQAAPPVSPRAIPSASPSVLPVGKHLPRSRPVRLLIPKIWVDAPFTALEIGPTGQLEPPPAADTNLVGWYTGGASPGETGTSVIAGHVDTVVSAAVFAGLGELKKDDTFRVVRADRRTATFVVDSVEQFDKDHFPSRRVYDDTPRAQVRLITCAGDYDRTVKDYTANLVVFAHLV